MSFLSIKRVPHLLRDILLDGILVAAVNPVQLKTEVDVVPHVVFIASMVVKTLHRGRQREGGAQSRSESLAAAYTQDRTVHMGCRLEQEHNDRRSIRFIYVCVKAHVESAENGSMLYVHACILLRKPLTSARLSNS